MGYLTSYKLDWQGVVSAIRPCPHCDGKGTIPVDDIVYDFVKNEPFLYGGTEPIAPSLEDSCKWYEHEEDMKQLSLKFPDVLFTLRGEGEESGDVWVKYFKEGKMQISKAEIKLEPFDAAKLA